MENTTSGSCTFAPYPPRLTVVDKRLFVNNIYQNFKRSAIKYCFICKNTNLTSLRIFCQDEINPRFNPTAILLQETFGMELELEHPELLYAKMCMSCRSKLKAAAQLRGLISEFVANMKEPEEFLKQFRFPPLECNTQDCTDELQPQDSPDFMTDCPDQEQYFENSQLVDPDNVKVNSDSPTTEHQEGGTFSLGTIQHDVLQPCDNQNTLTCDAQLDHIGEEGKRSVLLEYAVLGPDDVEIKRIKKEIHLPSSGPSGVEEECTIDDSNSGDHSYVKHISQADDAASGRSRSFERLHAVNKLELMPTNEIETLQNALVKGCTANAVAKVILNDCLTLSKTVEGVIIRNVGTNASALCTTTCTPGPSILRTLSNVDNLHQEDVLSQAILELRRVMPFVHDLFMTLCNPPDHPKPHSHHAVATMYGIAMYCRNSQLCALQKLNTAHAIRLNTHNELLDILNKICITNPAGSKTRLMSQLGHLSAKTTAKSKKAEKRKKKSEKKLDYAARNLVALT